MKRVAFGILTLWAFIPLLGSGCQAAQPREPEIILQANDLSAWESCSSGGHGDWEVVDGVAIDPGSPQQLVASSGTGILFNGPTGARTNICTLQSFGDLSVHIEFLVPEHSNSGIYFMGRYELQILDSCGRETIGYEDCGGVYARWVDGHTVDGHPPRCNACGKPGQWQAFDVLFRAPRFNAKGEKTENARFVSVKLNGIQIHKELALKGPTAGPLNEQECPRGPLRLQGDHGPVAFRNLRLQPLALD